MKKVFMFRAWSGRKMIYFNFRNILGALSTSQTETNLSATVGSLEIGDFTCIDCEENEHNVMQFTGLLDKNGKEIYEGDIVKDVSNYVYNGVVYVVKFGDYDNDGLYEDYIGGYGWYGEVVDGWLDKGDVIGFDRIKNVEVIGNIFENPELLKGGVE